MIDLTGDLHFELQKKTHFANKWDAGVNITVAVFNKKLFLIKYDFSRKRLY